MSDLEKKIVIPIEADPKKADAQVDKFKKEASKKEVSIPVNIDMSEITKALNSIQGMIGKIEKAFDKDIKFSGLQKGLDNVFNKLEKTTRYFKKGAPDEIQMFRVDVNGLKKLTDASEVIQKNIESLNNSKIDLDSFEKLYSIFEKMEALLHSIVKGMNFDNIRPSTQVQDEIVKTTEKLDKLAKSEERIKKLEGYFSNKTARTAGQSILEWGDSEEVKETSLQNLIKYMKEYIKLGGDLSKLSFSFSNIDTGTKSMRSFADVLEILKDEGKFDIIDSSQISNDVTEVKILRTELSELYKELNDAQIRENRDLNVSLDTKSVEEFSTAIKEAVQAIGNLQINIPDGFTFDGLSVENLEKIIGKLDEIVSTIKNIGTLLSTGIDTSNLNIDLDESLKKNLKDKVSIDVEVNPVIDGSEFIAKIEQQIQASGKKVKVETEVVSNEDKNDEIINNEAITGVIKDIQDGFQEISSNFGDDLVFNLEDFKGSLEKTITDIDYSTLFSSLRETLLNIVVQFQNSLQSVGLSSSQLDEAYKTIKGWNDADSYAFKKANVISGERGAFLNSKTGTISNSFFSDSTKSFQDSLFQAIKDLSVGVNGEISSIYDTWVHSHPFRESIEGLNAIGSDIGFSVSDLELGIEKLLKDKLPNMLLTQNYKFTNLDLSGVSEEITARFVEEYKKELLKAGLTEATVEGKKKIVFPSSLAKHDGVYDLDVKSNILNGAMLKAMSTVGIDSSRLKTGHIDELKVDLSDLQQEEQQATNYAEDLLSVLEKLNNILSGADGMLQLGVSEESLNGILNKLNDIVEVIKKIDTEKVEKISEDIDVKPSVDNKDYLTDTDVGTTGISYETRELESLQNKLVDVTAAVDIKTRAFKEEEQVVVGTVQREISNLELLDGQLLEIISTIERIKTTPINLDLKLSDNENVDDSLTKLLSDLDDKVKNLDVESLSKFATALKDLKVTGKSAENLEMVAVALGEFRASLAGISAEENNFLASISTIVSKTDELKDLVKVLESSTKKIKATGDAVDNIAFAPDKNEGNARKDPANKKSSKVTDSISKTINKMKELKSVGNGEVFEKAFAKASKRVEELNTDLASGKISLEEYNKIVKQIQTNISNNTFDFIEPNNLEAAKNSMREYADIVSNSQAELKSVNPTKTGKELTYTWVDQDKVVHNLKLSYDQLSGALTGVHKQQKQTEVHTKKLSELFRQGWQNVRQYVVSFVGFYEIINAVRNGITVIRDLDTALTEMRKVSDESIESLKNYQEESFDVASAVGTTAKQIQNSTADWMRLGESMQEAAESAKVANILLNVSEFDSIDEATESLVSMSAAYDNLSKMDIIDKLNQVGNNYSIATDGLATALQKSASALTTAGNDMDEAVALITAGNAVVQDANVVGTGMQTIALRLVGTKEAKAQLEELGEDTDDVITTTSKLRDTILSATAVASNQFKGFDILDENGNYKSTYEIMLGLSEIYNEIAETDKKMGNNNLNLLLETIAGKRRANIAASILQNNDLLESVYSSSQDSEGSAEKELEKYLDSIEGKISLFTNEVQEFWYNLISSETVKGIVSFGTWLMNFLGNVVDLLGEIGTLGAVVGTAFGVHKLKNSGGRVKKFTLVSNMPPNRLAERCASSGVYRSDNIFIEKVNKNKYVVSPIYTSRKT